MALSLRSSLLRFFCVAAACVIVARGAAQDGQAKDAPAKEPPAKGKFHHAVLIRFEGVILPHLREHLFRKLDAAKEDGADLVILEIESPGGMVSETFTIVERLQDMDAEGIHTVPSRWGWPKGPLPAARTSRTVTAWTTCPCCKRPPWTKSSTFSTRPGSRGCSW
jgi:membrane-bound ClpP family serine protease